MGIRNATRIELHSFNRHRMCQTLIVVNWTDGRTMNRNGFVGVGGRRHRRRNYKSLYIHFYAYKYFMDVQLTHELLIKSQPT